MAGDPVFFDRQEIAAVPWKNGGGQTQEVVAWSPASAEAGFDWRVSIATMEKDGPFSLFEGIDRSITLLAGQGIHLVGDGLTHDLIAPLQPFSFVGEQAVQGTLRAGTSTCFNVMARRGRCAADVVVIREHHAQDDSGTIDQNRHGLFLLAEGAWRCTLKRAGKDVQASLCPGQGFWWAGVSGTWQLEPLTDAAAVLWVTIRGGR